MFVTVVYKPELGRRLILMPGVILSDNELALVPRACSSWNLGSGMGKIYPDADLGYPKPVFSLFFALKH